jgi:putative exosortase-associated protein (TIGR04073 family)
MGKQFLATIFAVFFLFAVTPLLADVGPAEEAPEPQPPAQAVSYESTGDTSNVSGRRYNAGDKFIRGLANVLTSLLEIPRNVQNMTEDQGVLVGWTGGLAQGIGMMALRIIVGAYEIVTFPIPLPEDYKPVIEPEFPWEAPGPKVTPQG